VVIIAPPVYTGFEKARFNSPASFFEGKYKSMFHSVLRDFQSLPLFLLWLHLP